MITDKKWTEREENGMIHVRCDFLVDGVPKVISGRTTIDGSRDQLRALISKDLRDLLSQPYPAE